jgi:O-antigen chain-terminating methyltransferase
MTVSDTGDKPDFDALMETLERRIQERYASGEYPPTLEADLEEHFQRTTARVAEGEGALSVLLAELDRAGRFDTERIPVVSSVPGGSRVHRAIGAVVRRQINGVLLQLLDYHKALRAVLLEIMDSLPEHSFTELEARVDATLDQLGIRARLLGAAAAGIGPQPAPWYSRLAYIEAFQGSFETVVERYRGLVTAFKSTGPVLDLACGRGEMLDLLREAGIDAQGAEQDPDLVAIARKRGHTVAVADPLDFLESQPEGSVGGLFGSYLLERLGPQRVLDLVVAAGVRLRVGARAVLLAANPASAPARATDPAATAAVDARFAEFLFRQAGFAGVEIDWRRDRNEPPPEYVLTATR